MLTRLDDVPVPQGAELEFEPHPGSSRGTACSLGRIVSASRWADRRTLELPDSDAGITHRETVDDDLHLRFVCQGITAAAAKRAIGFTTMSSMESGRLRWGDRWVLASVQVQPGGDGLVAIVREASGG